MKIAPALLATCLLATACLENEESLQVHPDGSIQVGVTVAGDVDDLTRGYAVPLHAPWTALDSVTQAWASVFGKATGGPEVRARFEDDAWSEMGDPNEPKATLSAGARFRSAADLPEFYAPPDEPYRTAFLERNTSLEIETKGARTVYTLVRKYPARRFHAMFAEDVLPEDIMERVEAKRRVTDDQVTRATAAIREQVHAPTSMHLFTSALGAVYSEGDASLSSAAYERTVGRLGAAADAVLTEPNVRAFFDAVHDLQHDDSAQLPEELDLELRLRNAGREALAHSLQLEGIDEPVRNAVLERLEWNFTSLAHSKDLGDEKFTLHVSMPGTVVEGNYDIVVNGWATWQFEGEDLFGAERTMRIVSVLE